MKNFDEKMKNILSKDFDVPMSTQETIRNALNKEHKRTKKEGKFFKVASFVLALLLVGGLSTKAYIDFKETHREFSHVNVKIEDFEQINMDYVQSKDKKAGLKLEKLLLTDNDMIAIVKIKFNKKLEFNSNLIYPMFEYGVFDENKTPYCYSEGMLGGEVSGILDFYKRNKIEYKKNDVHVAIVASRCGLGYTDLTENEFTLILTATAERNKFPIANKLYFDMGKVGYREIMPDKSIRQTMITEDNWVLEIDIPENLKTRNTVEYKIKDSPESIDLETFLVTDTSTVIRVENKEMEWIFSPINGADVTENMNNNIYIIDENGVQYFAKGMSYAAGKLSGVFDLNIEKLTEKMYLKIYVEGEVIQLELTKK